MRSSGAAAVRSVPSSLLAFKPRQVVLSERNRTNSARLGSMAANPSEQELTLSCSVALWLEKKGFSKVLKRFLSAANIQDDEWKAKALNLNEIFSKYMEINVGASKGLDPEKEEGGDKKHTVSSENEIQTRKSKKKKNNEVADNGIAKAEDQPVEKPGDKKKKKSKSLDDEENNIVSKPEPTDKKESVISNGSLQRCDHLIADESKHKKKQQLKTDDPLNCEINVDLNKKEVHVQLEDSQASEKKTSKKDKTKVEKTTPKKIPDAAENKDDESTKASKKRKRKAVDENETPSVKEDAGQESKPKKTKSLKESKDVEQPLPNEHIVEPNNKESLEDENAGSQNLSAKQTENTIKSNGVNKSAKKQQKNSAEPKSANAFQRVKVDEVEFVDDRLQDNSYWAKDGAGVGYGAKAQEVLGQVKGKDFRHEKTKKKRGSYRGGQIDLQSHSVKFNYSEEDE